MFHKTTKAPTSAAISVIIIPIGFAFNATFKSHCAAACALVANSQDFTAFIIFPSSVTTLTIFANANAANIASIAVITVSLFSIIHLNISTPFPIAFPICCPTSFKFIVDKLFIAGKTSFAIGSDIDVIIVLFKLSIEFSVSVYRTSFIPSIVPFILLKASPVVVKDFTTFKFASSPIVPKAVAAIVNAFCSFLQLLISPTIELITSFIVPFPLLPIRKSFFSTRAK